MMQARQSLYPSNHHQSSLNSLSSCIASSQSCVQVLQASIETLDTVTVDFPRLKAVLSNRKHFDLISERDIQSARAHVSEEVLPHINELVSRASAEMEKTERKAIALRNKAAAQQARLDQLEEIDEMSTKAAVAEKRKQAVGSVNSSVGQAEKLKQMIAQEKKRLDLLRRKREELSTKVDQIEQEFCVD